MSNELKNEALKEACKSFAEKMIKSRSAAQPLLKLELLEQRAPKMLASIWPSRDKSHGTK